MRAERRRAREAIVMTLSMVVTGTLAAAPASAGPSVWSRARDPRVSVQDELVREAQKAVLAYRRALKAGGPEAAARSASKLRTARTTLAGVVSTGPTDFGVRLLYAQVLRDSNENELALQVLNKLLKDQPPAPIRSEAFADLAILHALAERREEEIRAYTDALAIEPHSYARSRLLANRAEALMATGDVTSAVEGYSAALAPLTSVEMFWNGPTTLFGLGVAHDRSGNPEAALAAVKLARQYDPTDRGFRTGTWFFSPANDEHWYWALGGWSCARLSESWAARSDCYETAITQWEIYIAKAPENDRWTPLAQVRLATVKRERDLMNQRFEAQKKNQRFEAQTKKRPKDAARP